MNFTLPIFPEGSLVSSIITTTWIGVMVVAFLNLRFGWVLSGLVVPGYMVPLLIVRPWAAAVVLLESVVTYVIVWAFSEFFSRAGYWGRLFGRDRFLALVICSVVVRILFDGWLLPALGAYVNERFDLQFQYASNLHSFGLIIISLTANQFWKTGLRKGLPALFVTIGVTYLIVRYGLMEFTNFRISALSYLYEDVATSILASPKAYIILLTTAYLASRMNLNYGLDYSGILIPALMALQWYQPGKVITTVVEAFVIYFMGLAVLRLPLFAHVTIEGARKLLLFFNVGFAYKMALGFVLLWLAPENKITDYFGFGYLLATMLAMKMHEKNILPRMTRATLQTSLVGAAAASIIGFCVMLVSEQLNLFSVSRTEAFARTEEPQGTTIDMLLDRDRVSLYAARLERFDPTSTPQEIETFVEALRLILRWESDGNQPALAKAGELLAGVQFSLLQVDGRYVYLRDDRSGSSRGAYIIDRLNADGLLVEIPIPVEFQGLVSAGLTLFKEMRGRAMAVAGAEWTATGAIGRSILSNGDTFFQAFHRLLAEGNVLQIRARQGDGGEQSASSTDDPAGGPIGNVLWIKDTLPPGLDARRLEQLIGRFSPPFGVTRPVNLQRDVTPSGFAELFIDPLSLRRLIALRLPPSAAGDGVSDAKPDTLMTRMLAAKATIAKRGTGLYVPPRFDELLFFDREVLTEVLLAARQQFKGGAWTPDGLSRLAAASVAAAALGYRIERIHDESAQAEFIVLAESGGSASGHRGTLVLRLGEAEPFLVEVPRPLLEVNTLEYGTQLFARLRARALFIAGAHPDANLDGSSDVANLRNRRSLLGLVQQVFLREAGRAPMMVVQCRAMRNPNAAAPAFDAILSLDSGAVAADRLSAFGRRLVDRIAMDGMRLRYADGSPDVAGHDIGAVSQFAYMQQARNKELAVLWLWLAARLPANPATVSGQDQLQFDMLGIPTEHTSLFAFLKRQGVVEESRPMPGIADTVADYRESQDVVLLQILRDRALGYRLVRLVDTTTNQPYVAFLEAATGRVAALAGLWPLRPDAVSKLSRDNLGPAAVSAVLDEGAAWVMFSARP